MAQGCLTCTTFQLIAIAPVINKPENVYLIRKKAKIG
jgi:hypothetical protein